MTAPPSTDSESESIPSRMKKRLNTGERATGSTRPQRCPAARPPPHHSANRYTASDGITAGENSNSPTAAANMKMRTIARMLNGIERISLTELGASRSSPSASATTLATTVPTAIQEAANLATFPASQPSNPWPVESARVSLTLQPYPAGFADNPDREAHRV